ncbi:MAG: hypothetical protein ACLUFV_11390 [Acutalibacteraceae bacterium]
MMAFISVYGVVDGFCLNFAGKTSFAAINLVMLPFVMLLGGIGFMVGTGGTALVSKVLGEGDREKGQPLFFDDGVPHAAARRTADGSRHRGDGAGGAL